MTFTVNDEENPAAAQGAAAYTVPPVFPNAATNGQPPAKMSLSAALSGVTRTVSADAGTEALTNFMLVADEIKKSMPVNGDFSVALVPLDRQTHNVGYFSVCAVMAQFTKYPELAAYHLLIIADSNLPMPDKTLLGPGNSKFTLPQVDGSAYDKEQCQLVDKHLLARFQKQVKLITADGTVVPRGFDLKNRDQIRGLIANAIFACANEVKVMTGQRWMFDANKMTLEPNNTKVAFNFSGGESAISYDIDGQPFRSSVSVTLTNQPERNSNESIHTAGNVAVIGQLLGHIEAVYAGPRSSLITDDNRYRCLAPMMVVNNFHSTVERTLPNLLLTLYSGIILAADNRWMNAFRLAAGSDNKSKVDLSNPGNLNALAKIPVADKPTPADSQFGQIMPISQSEFGTSMFSKYLDAIFHPGTMLFAVDYQSRGPTSWLFEPFMAAAQGRGRGVDEICDIINVGTGGIFATKFNKKTQPVFMHSLLMRSGSFDGGNGKRLPLSLTDLTYVTGACANTHPDAIRDWLETMTDGKYSQQFRLHGRDALQKMLTNQRDVKFTGETVRLVFSTEFIKAVLSSYLEAKVFPGVIDDPTSGNFVQANLTSPWALNGLNLASGFGTTTNTSSMGWSSMRYS